MKEYITPAKAEELLKFSNKRPTKRAKLKLFIDDMNIGNWRYDNDIPIIIGESGMVLDGNHRLKAIVESGKGGNFEVIRNKKDDLINYVDIGTPRTKSDILFMDNVPNSKIIATVIYNIFRFVYKSTAAIRNNEVLNIYLHNEREYQASAVFGSKLHRNTRFLPAAQLASLHYMMSRVKIRDYENRLIEFCEGTLKKGKLSNYRSQIIRFRTKGFSIRFEEIFKMFDDVFLITAKAGEMEANKQE